jgi:hypothetical protein
MRWRGPIDIRDAAVSVAEEQPEQDDHRDWHTQQPQQNSASHRLLLVFAFAGATPARRPCSVSLSGCPTRQPDLEQQMAVAIDGLAHFGIDVGGFADAHARPFGLARFLRKRRAPSPGEKAGWRTCNAGTRNRRRAAPVF